MDPNTEPQNETGPNSSEPPGGAAPPEESNNGEWVLSPEDYPNIDDLVLEDSQPVDNIFTEKQHRLLVEPLYSSWPGPGEGVPFVVLANVGFFRTVSLPPLVPDVMLSLEVQVAADLSRKENRSYLLWVMGKPPDVVIEIVSDRRGGEAGHKMRDYAYSGVGYYVILDPRELLGAGSLQVFRRAGRTYEPTSSEWLHDVGLGLTLWQGVFEGHEDRWLRWCDRQGKVIPTGQERAEQERQRAEQERQRAEQERQRAEQEQQRAERLAAQLRALGIDPSA